MSVGAASIKRAASKAASEETMKKTEVKAESGSGAEENAPVKKTSARKKTTPKKVTSAAIPSVSPEVVDKMKLNHNEVCHLTEELPVHLL